MSSNNCDVLRKVTERSEMLQAKKALLRSEKEETEIFEMKLFDAEFSRQLSTVENRLHSCTGSSTSEFDLLLDKCRALQLYLNANIPHLPPHDISQRNKDIVTVFSKVNARRSESQPVKKFSFSKKPSSNSTTASLGTSVTPTLMLLPQSVVSSKRKSEEPSVEDNHSASTTARISNKTGERIEVDFSESVFFDSLSNCTIYCNQSLSNSAFITNCGDCLFVLRAQQLRLHTSSRCQLYLSCVSTPIIEQCEEIGFAPFPEDSESLMNPDWTITVHDFNWLRAGPSPHWRILTPSQRPAIENLVPPPKSITPPPPPPP